MSLRGEGWYADPQDEFRLRWWDGVAWTENTLALADNRPDLPRWWRAVSVAVQLALLGCLLAAAFTLYVDLEILGFVDDVRLRPDTVVEADGVRIDNLIAISATEVVATLVTGILFISWLYTAHHSSRMDRRALRHASGWAIGGWFVPVLNLWRPFQMVTDVRRGATGERDVDVPLTQGWWWGTYTLSYVVSSVATWFYDEAARTPDAEPEAYLDAFATAARWERYSAVLTILAAILAILVVREITARVRAGSTEA